MQNKRVIEILIGVMLIMSTVASIGALILYQPTPNNLRHTINSVHLFVINVLLGAGTFITAYVILRKNLAPGFISTLGLMGGIIILLRATLLSLGLFEQPSLWGVLLLIPFFGYEVCLTLFLFSKGFNEVKLAPPLKQNLFKLSKSEDC